MDGKVSRKSEYGLQLEGNQEWFNYGNFYKGSKAFDVGDAVSIETKGKYLVSINVIQKTAQSSQVVPPLKNDSTVRSEIARMAATKAVFGSPILAQQYQNYDSSEAVEYLKNLTTEVTNYILTGKFNTANLTEETKQ